jgi:hypothetical protein
MSLAATISAATGKLHTLGITLSDSNGPLGLASLSRQYSTVWPGVRAGETKLPTAREGAASSAGSGARAPRAHGVGDHLSMVIERPMSQRNVIVVDSEKSY